MNHTYIAVSIVLGFSLVALAVFFSLGTSVDTSTATKAQTAETESLLDKISVEEITRSNNRHLYGNKNAEITIVEFSDFECSFCSRLSPTLKKLVDESDGKILWEYRHLPLPNHKNAFKLALSSECVAEQQGDEGFWQYTKAVFSKIGSAKADYHRTEAEKLGVDLQEFDVCLENDTIRERVEKDAGTARKIGGKGTPFSVIIDQEGNRTPVSGALPYHQWQSILSTFTDET